MKELRELANRVTEGNVFQVDTIARAMLLRWKCGWHILATPRRLVWLEGKPLGREIRIRLKKMIWDQIVRAL